MPPQCFIDHLGIVVPKDRFEEVVDFYLKALAPLGCKKVMEFPLAVGMGVDGKPSFWIGGKDVAETVPIHFGFSSPNRAMIDACYNAAIEAGGKCNGKPGLREHYHPNYYGAFFFDPVGNNAEVVCHIPE